MICVGERTRVYVAEGGETELRDGAQQHLRGQVEDLPPQLDAERLQCVDVGVEEFLRAARAAAWSVCPTRP